MGLRPALGGSHWLVHSEVSSGTCLQPGVVTKSQFLLCFCRGGQEVPAQEDPALSAQSTWAPTVGAPPAASPPVTRLPVTRLPHCRDPSPSRVPTPFPTAVPTPPFSGLVTARKAPCSVCRFVTEHVTVGAVSGRLGCAGPQAQERLSPWRGMHGAPSRWPRPVNWLQPRLLPEDREGLDVSASCHCWSLVTSPAQGPPRAPPQNRRYTCHPGHSRGLRTRYRGPGEG